jgi:hypothetical protein
MYKLVSLFYSRAIKPYSSVVLDTQTKWEPVAEVSVRKPSHDPIDLVIPSNPDPTKPFAFFADAEPPPKEPIPTPIPEPQAHVEGPTRSKPVARPEPVREPQAHVEGPTRSKPLARPEPVREPGAKPRYAIVTSVWDYNYASLALMLGWSIQKHNDLSALGVELVLLTLYGGHLGDVAAPGITALNRTRLEKAGWKIRTEERLKVPSVDFSLIKPHRRLNLNKLKIFGWDEYDKIVFMDADTLVKGSIEDLFTMPGDFAAAPDVWFDIPHDPRFNSGVMVFKPRKWLFENMVEKLGDPEYHDPTEGDQAFLQKYWEYENWGLPTIYNLNLIMYEHYRKTWDHLWMNTRIVHFTVRKPQEAWSKEGQCKRPIGKPGAQQACALWVPLTVGIFSVLPSFWVMMF